MSRIKDHEKHYEPVDEPHWPHIKIINVRLLQKNVLDDMLKFYQ